MLFQKDQLLVRGVEVTDAKLLSKWLSNERVLFFFGGRDQPHDEEMIRHKYLAKREGSTYRCIAEWKGKPVGFLQFYKLDENRLRLFGYPLEVPVWGMDQFIGEPDCWNQGIGTQLVRMGTDFLVEEKAAEIVIMDPQVRNTRAIRCYEKCGFRKVRMLPRHELHEGVWQSCWLMEYDSEYPEYSR
ncbi:GNAT family N-acetyltransferase [Salinithrix halophila]|uniref:GNAT family N-acetyltransferase n=1 Tax=Salinithrix halophila TaxID=1485204 RepID=A0ABV8JFW5_9BACL